MNLALFGLGLIVFQTVQAVSKAEEPKPRVWPYQDECGDPSLESSSWWIESGRVITVESGDRIQIRNQRTGRITRVNLAGLKAPELSTPSGQEAKVELQRRVLGLTVDVWVRISADIWAAHPSADVYGVVFLGSRDINFKLVEAGKCRYSKAPAYSMSSYIECTYRQVEKQAMAMEVGIWSKQ